jgi:lysophospholipase L1-like esterase
MKRRSTAFLATATVALTMGLSAVAVPAQAATDFTYVALGDSYAAGTGTATGPAPLGCFQSDTSYPNQLAAYGGIRAGEGGRLRSPGEGDRDGSRRGLAEDAQLTTGFINVTCAGATTSYIGTELSAAVQAGATSGVSQVTVTVGGNDLGVGGFAQTLQACAKPASLECQTALATATSNLKTETLALTGVITQIRGAAPGARIYVTGYPLLFGNFKTPTCNVGGAYVVPKTTATTINGITSALNLSIAGAVVRAQWKGDWKVRYVPVTGAFYGHGLCDSKTPWINRYVASPYEFQSFHPNASGETAYATTLKLAGAK